MKLSYIFIIVIIAVTVGIIVSTSSDASTYVTFDQAKEIANEGSKKKIHVVGTVKKDPAGKLLINYDPKVDPNYFSFVMIDDKNKESEVVYLHPKPQDFGSAEKVVVIGNYEGTTFMASKILLKCPSKYENGDPTKTGKSVALK